jgi:hypothetical protein
VELHASDTILINSTNDSAMKAVKKYATAAAALFGREGPAEAKGEGEGMLALAQQLALERAILLAKICFNLYFSQQGAGTREQVNRMGDGTQHCGKCLCSTASRHG